MLFRSVSTASLVFFIKPGLAPILAALILHEQILWTTVVGIVVILIGSVVTFVGNRFRERDTMGAIEQPTAAATDDEHVIKAAHAVSNQEN